MSADETTPSEKQATEAAAASDLQPKRLGAELANAMDQEGRDLELEQTVEEDGSKKTQTFIGGMTEKEAMIHLHKTSWQPAPAAAPSSRPTAGGPTCGQGVHRDLSRTPPIETK